MGQKNRASSATSIPSIKHVSLLRSSCDVKSLENNSCFDEHEHHSWFLVITLDAAAVQGRLALESPHDWPKLW